MVISAASVAAMQEKRNQCALFCRHGEQDFAWKHSNDDAGTSNRTSKTEPALWHGLLTRSVMAARCSQLAKTGLFDNQRRDKLPQEA
jgi:hypothetical protein